MASLTTIPDEVTEESGQVDDIRGSDDDNNVNGGGEVDYTEPDDILRKVFVESARDGNAEMVERILNKKVYPDIVVNQTTALNQAVLNSHIEVVEILLQRKADIEKRDAGGQHPLMKCARSGKGDLCDLLLAAKAETNAVDSYGQTALHKAARHGHEKICVTLIEHKADLNISETIHGQTPLMFAAIKNSEATVEILINAKADATIHNYAGLTAKQVAHAKTHRAVEKIIPKDPNSGGCVLL